MPRDWDPLDWGGNGGLKVDRLVFLKLEKRSSLYPIPKSIVHDMFKMVNGLISSRISAACACEFRDPSRSSNR